MCVLLDVAFWFCENDNVLDVIHHLLLRCPVRLLVDLMSDVFRFTNFILVRCSSKPHLMLPILSELLYRETTLGNLQYKLLDRCIHTTITTLVDI